MRELENAIERAVVICRGNEIQAQDLAPAVASQAATFPAAALIPVVPGASLGELERHAIIKTLQHVGGSTIRAAEILGISPRTIQYRLREYAGEPRSGKGGDADEAGDGEPDQHEP